MKSFWVESVEKMVQRGLLESKLVKRTEIFLTKTTKTIGACEKNRIPRYSLRTPPSSLAPVVSRSDQGRDVMPHNISAGRILRLGGNKCHSGT